MVLPRDSQQIAEQAPSIAVPVITRHGVPPVGLGDTRVLWPELEVAGPLVLDTSGAGVGRRMAYRGLAACGATASRGRA